jgi:hypothetical protein
MFFIIFLLNNRFHRFSKNNFHQIEIYELLNSVASYSSMTLMSLQGRPFKVILANFLASSTTFFASALGHDFSGSRLFFDPGAGPHLGRKSGPDVQLLPIPGHVSLSY